MPNYTTNLNLELPFDDEQYDVAVTRRNNQLIDDFAGLIPPRALTADKLTQAVNINGVAFRGDEDITIYDNTKANITGSNITSDFSTNLISNMSDTANIYFDSLSFPSSTKVKSLTVGSAGSSYTAPANGWFQVLGHTTNATNHVNLHGGGLVSIHWNAPNNNQIGVYLPCLKGTEVILNYTGMNIQSLKFIYALGSESESEVE